MLDAEGFPVRSDYFLGFGAILLSIAIFGLLLGSNFPGSAETVRGIFFVTLTLAPAVVGMILMALGGAQWYLEQSAPQQRTE